jgi:hypothetical protein
MRDMLELLTAGAADYCVMYIQRGIDTENLLSIGAKLWDNYEK